MWHRLRIVVHSGLLAPTRAVETFITRGADLQRQTTGVRQVSRLRRQRHLRDQETTETVYYVTSLSTDCAPPDRLMQLHRNHWGVIENGLHYVRDEAFQEDRSTIRTGDASQNLAALRNGVLNWLRRTGHSHITPTLREFAWNFQRLFAMFGYPNQATALAASEPAFGTLARFISALFRKRI